jgi:3-hydroxybutyryl-CoA dehydrogenase
MRMVTDALGEGDPFMTEQSLESKRMGVIGAGSMGAGIAQLAAENGLTVILCDNQPSKLDDALSRIRSLLNRAVQRGKLTADQAAECFAHIEPTTTLEALSTADFCIEAVYEDLQVKQAVFRDLSVCCKPDTVLATNTSSIPITHIAQAAQRPERVVGMHFFNPPQVMRLVEVVRGLDTSDETVAQARAMVTRLGKTAVEVKRDRPGFIVNRIMIPQFIEAIRLVEEGVATAEDVDTAVKLGLNYPMGPFELLDFGGLEIALHTMDVFYEETKDPRYAAPVSLRNLVRSGRLGRKTGEGWYKYEEGGSRQ